MPHTYKPNDIYSLDKCSWIIIGFTEILIHISVLLRHSTITNCQVDLWEICSQKNALLCEIMGCCDYFVFHAPLKLHVQTIWSIKTKLWNQWVVTLIRLCTDIYSIYMFYCTPGSEINFSIKRQCCLPWADFQWHLFPCVCVCVGGGGGGVIFMLPKQLWCIKAWTPQDL